jgi:hypothetical protein
MNGKANAKTINIVIAIANIIPFTVFINLYLGLCR